MKTDTKLKKGRKSFELTWPILIIAAILIGVIAGIIPLIPATYNTSLRDIDVYLDVWILFGIFIIMKSKNPIDSALKCFIFFLISQPLIYIVQDVVKGSNLLGTYYKTWFLITLCCIPMGHLGYYIKKDKLWGILILLPMQLLHGLGLAYYLNETIVYFPTHLLSTIFVITCLLIYPFAIFKEKRNRICSLIISIIVIIAAATICILKPSYYETNLLTSGSLGIEFDENADAHFSDNKFGDITIEYLNSIEAYSVNVKFKKLGETRLILKDLDGKEHTIKLIAKRNTYDIEEIK